MHFELLVPIGVLCVVLVGHFGIWIALYNRINATGIKRTSIKRIEKGIVAACIFIPILFLCYEWQGSSNWNALLPSWSDLSWLSRGYGIVAVAACLVMAPLWIADRPWFRIATDRYVVESEENLLNLERSYPDFCLGNSFRRMSVLPGNQIVSFQLNRKTLKLDRLHEGLCGLRIAHLSDVHFTGQLPTDFYRLIVDWVMSQQPDLIVVSGDIVDYEESLDQIVPVFRDLVAPMGMYFVLGNHDRRIPKPEAVCERFGTLSWTDLGRVSKIVRKGNTRLRLIGNELPWFRRHVGVEVGGETGDRSEFDFTLGVSHSPDQIGWGIASRCGLLLCGHTHGGQVRFPLIGPVFAPSWYGTRYASGVFVEQGMVMHVSRGISGVHPFRWGCLPEVSVLELEKF